MPSMRDKQGLAPCAVVARGPVGSRQFCGVDRGPSRSSAFRASGGLRRVTLVVTLSPVEGHAPELISDDPRKDVPHACEVRQLSQAFDRHGPLVTTSQAGKILGRSTAQVLEWIKRGRFTSVKLLGVSMLPMEEVMAYKRLRDSGADLSGGRGRRCASKSDLLKAS